MVLWVIKFLYIPHFNIKYLTVKSPNRMHIILITINGNKISTNCVMFSNDIIIGMLQTLSMKEFANNRFDDIGHVIIDECHCIPSRVFSRALLKINSPYMLGISATPNRKDGLTKVLKYYRDRSLYPFTYS